MRLRDRSVRRACLTRRRRGCARDALRAEDDAWEHGSEIRTSSFTQALQQATVSAGGKRAPRASGSRLRRTAHRCTVRMPRRPLAGRVISKRCSSVRRRQCSTSRPGRLRTSEEWRAAVETLTSNGERVVALAKQVDQDPPLMRALIGFADPPRPGVAEAMAVARRAGIHVLIVTGDHPTTAPRSDGRSPCRRVE